MRRFVGRCPIIQKEKISSSIVKLSFKAEDIAKSVLPGQFVQIRVSDNFIPLWPRPFSVYDTDPEKGAISVILKIAGHGTNLLAEKKEGEALDILGPLGNGFDMPRIGGNIIMAAGGVGMPPLFLLSKIAIKNGFPSGSIIFISGARSKSELFNSHDLTDLNTGLHICTDDGSAGEKGTVVDILNQLLKSNGDYTVYSCGPAVMLEKVDQILKKKSIPGFLSLEQLMPCGYGICSGCAVKVIPEADRGETDDNRDFHLKRVCVEGPVFRAGEVIWQ